MKKLFILLTVFVLMANLLFSQQEYYYQEYNTYSKKEIQIIYSYFNEQKRNRNSEIYLEVWSPDGYTQYDLGVIVQLWCNKNNDFYIYDGYAVEDGMWAIVLKRKKSYK